MYWLLVFDKTLKVLTAGLFISLIICLFVKPITLLEIEKIPTDSLVDIIVLMGGVLPWLALAFTLRLSLQQARKDFKRREIFRRMF